MYSVGFAGALLRRGRGQWRDQSTFAPDSLTTLPQRGISSLISAANCSGVPPAGSAPASLSFLLTSGSFSALLNSAFTLAITSFGVFAGARRPNQVTASKPL